MPIQGNKKLPLCRAKKGEWFLLATPCAGKGAGSPGCLIVGQDFLALVTKGVVIEV